MRKTIHQSGKERSIQEDLDKEKGSIFYRRMRQEKSVQGLLFSFGQTKWKNIGDFL